MALTFDPYVRFQFFKKVNNSVNNQEFNEMTFIPILPHKRRAFETKIISLIGLGAEIAILVFAPCLSTVPPQMENSIFNPSLRYN